MGFDEGTDTGAGVEGVEICVNSLSDGAWDVAGVSGSDGAAMVDVSDTSSCTTAFSSSPVVRFGSATTSLDSCRFCRRLRRREALVGKVAFSEDMKY